MVKCQYKDQNRHVFLSRILRQMNLLHLTFLLIRLNLKNQHRQCPRVASRSNVLQIQWTVRNLRNAPGRTMMRILYFSVCHRGLGKVSENLKDGNGVFGGTYMSGLVCDENHKLRQKFQSTVDANSVRQICWSPSVFLETKK